MGIGKSADIYDKFLDEYESRDAVRKYSAETAGYGINFLLRNDYARIYLAAVESYLRRSPQRPMRLLEFGCGAGMNIIRLTSLLEKRGIAVQKAYGTDFSPRLVESAKQQSKLALSPDLASKLDFFVARNENLEEDLAKAEGKPAESMRGYFDLIIGVNTFRYCHRLGKSRECARDIYHMLRPGGICINIDMNNRFPAFRSKLRRSVEDPAECYLPTLEEYSSPFRAVGFDVVMKKNFCWIPHSAGRVLTIACMIMTPMFNLLAQGRAMRSLIVARKPA